MKIKISKLTVNPLNEQIYGEESVEELATQISRSNFIATILIKPDFTIISGHRRVKACKSLDIQEIEALIVTKDFEWQYEELFLLENDNRIKTEFQQAQEYEYWKKIEEKKAKQRMAVEISGVGVCTQVKGKSRDIAAAKLGKSGTTMERTVKVINTIKSESPELFEKVKKGEITIKEAKTQSKKEVVIAKLNDIKVQEVKKIEGVYDVLVIDPPWDMEKVEREVRENQVGFDYPTMTEDQLKALKLPMADDCHVWLWTTHKFLPTAFSLLDTWGLKYVCTFVWHKNGGFQAWNLPQYNCEFVLYARKGTPTFIDTKDFMTCFDAKRTGHSVKPDEFYDVVRRVTAGRRLDMFNRREIEGFNTYGNEAK